MFLKPSDVDCYLTISPISNLVKLLAQMLHPSAIPWCIIIDFTIRIKIVIRKIISALLELSSSACIDEGWFLTNR